MCIRTILRLNRSKPKVFRLSTLRSSYWRRPITQSELADISGVSLRSIQRMEESRNLPKCVLNLIRIALALDINVTHLVSSGILQDLQSEIDSRIKKQKL